MIKIVVARNRKKWLKWDVKSINFPPIEASSTGSKICFIPKGLISFEFASKIKKVLTKLPWLYTPRLSLSLPADIDSEHRRRSVVIVVDSHFFFSFLRPPLLGPSSSRRYSATTCLLKCIMSSCAQDDRQVQPSCETYKFIFLTLYLFIYFRFSLTLFFVECGLILTFFVSFNKLEQHNEYKDKGVKERRRLHVCV